ncbi:hypothetical protein BTVI_56706 [Pitangus sulphuratus]|nr:hypothetical protein BTVI_56706 [Pitangus sulphuratus]
MFRAGYVREGRFRIEERTLTAFQWLYSPHQHRIVSRADLGSPSSSFAPRALKALKYLSAQNHMDKTNSGRVAVEGGGPRKA